jgi:hypothetical protein
MLAWTVWDETLLDQLQTLRKTIALVSKLMIFIPDCSSLSNAVEMGRDPEVRTRVHI